MVNPIDDEQEKEKNHKKGGKKEKKEKSITYTVYVRNEKVDHT
jgi:hypothetical protein